MANTKIIVENPDWFIDSGNTKLKLTLALIKAYKEVTNTELPFDNVIINNENKDKEDKSKIEKVITEKQPSILKIDRSQPFDPETFIGKGYSIVEEDENSLKLTEIDLNKILLKTTLKENESSVAGEERLERLKAMGYVRLDINILKTLWENQSLIPEHWKKNTNETTTNICFDGTILKNSHGHRFIVYLSWESCYNVNQFIWNCFYLGYDRYSNSPSAVLSIT